MIKQVIVVRTDLNMRKGKLASQACHASMKVFFDKALLMCDEDKILAVIPLNEQEEEWIEGIFTKIVVGVDSEEMLLNCYNQAKESGILCSLITDNGLTEFHGVPTNTCIAIGPDHSEKIDAITGHLKLL